MTKPRICAIVAIGKNRELGKKNKLIWKLDADFVRMKNLIAGHTLVMGRKTYESIGCELPHCVSVVVTSDKQYSSPYTNAEHTTVVHSLDEALIKATDLELKNESSQKEIFIFGGAQIYTEALPKVERLYLTKIEASDSEADSYFPEYSEFSEIIEKTEHEEGGIHFQLLTLQRQK